MPAPEWLIDGILPEGGFCGIYGPPWTGKSFLAMDMALSVGAGGFWHGHPVQRGFVLYVAAEGGPGIGKRARAWLAHRGVQPSDVEVAWLTEPISVYRDSADMDMLMGRIEDEIRRIPRFIVIDTLARCFEGEENETGDMSRFVSGIDRMRHEYGATLLVVHHTRLDGERERGNTAFRGGTDTMMAVSRAGKRGVITMECTKQKDAEDFADLHFQLAPVPGVDSVVIVEDGVDRATKLIRLLVTAKSPLGPKAFQRLAQSHGMSRATFFRALADTTGKGQIIEEKGRFSVSVSRALLE